MDWRTLGRNTTLMVTIGVVLLLPVLAAQYPPLGDYPNHMARVWILLHYDQSPFFQSLVDLNPNIVPNLGFESLLLALARVLPFMTAGRATVGIILTCHLLACVLLARAINPNNSWHGLAVGLMGVHGGVQAGFLSYSWGVAWSLTALACWLRWVRGDGTRWGIAAAGIGFASAVIHATAPVTLVVTVGAIITMDFVTRRTGVVSSARRAAPLLPAVSGFLLLRQAAGPDDGDPLRWNTLSGKVAALMTWSRTYDLTLDLAWLAGFVVIIAITVRLTRLRGVDRSLMIAGSALLLMALLMPVAIMTGSGADARLVPPAATIMLLALAPMIQQAGRATLIASIALVLVRQAAITERWAAHSAKTAHAVELLAIIPANSLLLQCQSENHAGIDDAKNAMPFRHIGQYLTVTNDGIARSIFGFATQQPIIVKKPRLDQAAHAVDGDCRTPTWPWILIEKTASPRPLDPAYTISGENADWQLWQRNQTEL